MERIIIYLFIVSREASMSITFTLVLVALSPLILNAIRREDWSPSILAGVTLGVTVTTFLLGQFLDGGLFTLSSQELLIGYLLTITSNQSIYQIIKKTDLMIWLEGVGNPKSISVRSNSRQGQTQDHTDTDPHEPYEPTLE